MLFVHKFVVTDTTFFSGCTVIIDRKFRSYVGMLKQIKLYFERNF